MVMMVATMGSGEVMTRDKVAVADTWDLGEIFPDQAAWEADADRVRHQLATVAAHRDMLGASPMALYVALNDAMDARLTIERLITYAALRKDEDTTNTDALARFERATAIAIGAAEVMSYIDPEILALPPETLDAFIAAPVLVGYRHMLEDLRRQRPHVRSIEVEEVLAQAADMTRSASDAFGALDNADLAYGVVHDEDGNELELTKARFGLLLESKDRAVRREAHETLSAAYLTHRYTLASLYGSSVRKDVFYAKVHRHESVRAAALFGNNIPESV